MDRDLVCLSHLRWDFVYQRPHHLMSRFARTRRVYFVEEPELDASSPELRVRRDRSGVKVVTPHLPQEISEADSIAEQRRLLDLLIEEEEICTPVRWFYTPMALDVAGHVHASVTIYDCMDELSAFRDAPRRLLESERRLFAEADLVFTGGQSLYESKRSRHPSVHCFPSSVDRDHFCSARDAQPEPEDQAAIPRPRIGFFGVLDERLDLELLDSLARARPDWHLVMIGPVTKIEQSLLPVHPNVHYLGSKEYDHLPAYLAGWDVAILPFALNESTRFISPTKTPEYLAAGRPVVSTPIRDVVRPYGERGLVRVASDSDSFVAAVEQALQESPEGHWGRVDRFLAGMSWNRTWSDMDQLIREMEASRSPQRTVEVANV